MAAIKSPRVQSKKSVTKKVGKKKLSAKRPGAKKSTTKKPTAKKVPAKSAPAAKKAVTKKAATLGPMSELAKKRSIKKALTTIEDGKTVVDAYVRDLDHPFKAELEAVREIIVGASPKIAERIKWNAPSFYYKEDLGAFNLRATQYAHLILLFPGGAGMDDDMGLLEGNHKDRREAKFHNMDDVNAKKSALEALVQRWVALRDS
jgi:hypothetical protein